MRARSPGADLVTVQEVGLRAIAGPDLLAWAAASARVVLTHDATTLIGYAFERVRLGLPMPGVIHMPNAGPIASAIEDL